MTIELQENVYSIYKFSPDFIFDNSVLSDDFISITKTKDELSIVALQDKFTDYVNKEDGWRILKILGVLDFNLVGVISKISAILANEGISVFVVSTFNTDYILVKEDNAQRALELLKLRNIQ